MEMIVTSESTALIVMSSDTSVGTPPSLSSPLRSGGGTPRTPRPPPVTLPSRMNASTGTTIVPNAPSGSRRKILISSQVRCQSPRSIVFSSVADRVAGQLQEHVLEVRQLRAKLRDSDAILRDALDDVGHEPVPDAADREAIVVPLHDADAREAITGVRIARPERHAPLGAVPVHEPLRRVDVDDAAALDHRNAVAQTLGLFHQVGREKDGLAALANPADELPDRAPRLRV